MRQSIRWNHTVTSGGSIGSNKRKNYEVKTAFGAGGQMIYIVPEFDMVVVFTAEKADKRKLLALLQNTIVPAFLIDE